MYWIEGEEIPFPMTDTDLLEEAVSRAQGCGRTEDHEGEMYGAACKRVLAERDRYKAECAAWRAAALADDAADEAWELTKGKGSGPEYKRAKELTSRFVELQNIARAALKGEL